MTKQERETLIVNNMGLVNMIARRYFNSKDGMQFDDLLQAGAIGLIRAIDLFDPNKGKLSTYAAIWIQHEIFKYLDSTRPVLSGISSDDKRAFRTINKIINKIKIEIHNIDHEPSNEEIIKHEDFKKVLKSHRSKQPIKKKSMQLLKRYRQADEVLFFEAFSPDFDKADDHDSGEHSLYFTEGYEDPCQDFTEICARDMLIDAFLDKLPENQQKVIKLYYGLNEERKPMNFIQISKELKISRPTVQKLHDRGIDILKKRMAFDEKLFLQLI